jgi:probable rRNA maturation factor
VLSQGTRGTPAHGLGAWLARMAPARARGQVSVAIVSDRTMKALNKRFRRVNKATDVLSFPSRQPSGKRAKGKWQEALSPVPLALSPDLGEIVIARGVAARQARALGHSLRTELRVLALHGLLHLLGYDHEVDNGQMALAEGRLRRRAGLPDGLIARSS